MSVEVSAVMAGAKLQALRGVPNVSIPLSTVLSFSVVSTLTFKNLFCSYHGPVEGGHWIVLGLITGTGC